MNRTKKGKPESNIQAILINADNTIAALGMRCGKSTVFGRRLAESQTLGRGRRRIHRTEDTFIYE